MGRIYEKKKFDRNIWYFFLNNCLLPCDIAINVKILNFKFKKNDLLLT